MSRAERAKILTPTPENICLAAEALRRGEVVGMPTETVYGLAGSAFDPAALARIFEAKERPTFDPLIVHVPPGPPSNVVAWLESLRLVDSTRLSPQACERVEALARSFWPGPLTLVLPKHADVPDLATSGLMTVALRMPKHSIAQALIMEARTPLAAPSANRFGRISPTSATAVVEELGDRIDWVLDGGPSDVGVESTVIRVEEDGQLILLRPGGLARESIEAALGASLHNAPSRVGSHLGTGAAQVSPGMLESHYAPSKPLYLLPGPIGALTPKQWAAIQSQTKNAAFLLMESREEKLVAAHFEGQTSVRSLCAGSQLPSANLAARRLFAALRELDGSSASVIFSEPCPWITGLGQAIADRLKRASRGEIK